MGKRTETQGWRGAEGQTMLKPSANKPASSRASSRSPCPGGAVQPENPTRTAEPDPVETVREKGGMNPGSCWVRMLSGLKSASRGRVTL